MKVKPHPLHKHTEIHYILVFPNHKRRTNQASFILASAPLPEVEMSSIMFWLAVILSCESLLLSSALSPCDVSSFFLSLYLSIYLNRFKLPFLKYSLALLPLWSIGWLFPFLLSLKNTHILNLYFNTHIGINTTWFSRLTCSWHQLRICAHIDYVLQFTT